MAAEVYWLDSQQDVLQIWLGRLEGLLARHWPELTTAARRGCVLGSVLTNED